MLETPFLFCKAVKVSFLNPPPTHHPVQKHYSDETQNTGPSAPKLNSPDKKTSANTGFAPGCTRTQSPRTL